MTYQLDFSKQSLEDIRKIKKSCNLKLFDKVPIIFDELLTHPTTGTGKSE